MSAKPCFKTPFDSQHVKGFQTHIKSAWQYFYQILLSLWEKLSAWVICETLENFGNTFTADD